MTATRTAEIRVSDLVEGQTMIVYAEGRMEIQAAQDKIRRALDGLDDDETAIDETPDFGGERDAYVGPHRADDDAPADDAHLEMAFEDAISGNVDDALEI